MVQNINHLTLIQNFSPDRQESIIRFGSMLYNELNKRIGTDRLTSISASPVVTRFFQKDSGFLKKWSSYIDKLFLFNSRLVVSSRKSLYHVVCQPEYLTGLTGKVKLITCHDLIPILQEKENLAGGLSQGSLASFLLRWWEIAYRSADHIVCVSENTKKDLLRLIEVDPTKVSVIYNSLNRDFSRLHSTQAAEIIALQVPELVNHPFILHVGNSFPHKNRVGIIQVFNQLASENSDLFMAFCGKAFSEHEALYIGKSPFKSRILHILQPEDEMLDALYSRAQLLLFPSLYEGFGWPIIEAMACGCPAIGSNAGSLKEIIFDQNLAPDPNDYDQIAAICRRLLSDINYRKNVINRGLEYCKLFSTNQMLNGYMEVYKMLGLKIES